MMKAAAKAFRLVPANGHIAQDQIVARILVNAAAI
jgi:hypothetical protein